MMNEEARNFGILCRNEFVKILLNCNKERSANCLYETISKPIIVCHNLLKMARTVLFRTGLRCRDFYGSFIAKLLEFMLCVVVMA